MEGSTEQPPTQEAGSCALTECVQRQDDDRPRDLDGMQEGPMNTCDQQHVCNLGGEHWTFQHHPWTDDTAKALAAYERSQHLTAPIDDTGIPAPGSVPRSNVEALRKAMESQVALQQTQDTTQSQQMPVPHTLLHSSSTDIPQQPPVSSVFQAGTFNVVLSPTEQPDSSASADVSNKHSLLSEQNNDLKVGKQDNKRHGGKLRRKPADAQQQHAHSLKKHTDNAGTHAGDEYGVPEASVSAVLSALKEAVRIRCHCIKEHTAIQVQNPPCDSSTQHDHFQDATIITDSLTQPATCQHASSTENSSICHGTECTADTSTQPPPPSSNHIPTQSIQTGHHVASQLSNQQACAGIQNVHKLSAAPVLILFSGGVDSTLIAALSHQCLPPDVPIDLSNVCFNNGKSPDRLAAISALHELKR